MKAPIAKKVVKKLTTHGEQRNDPYYWMRGREKKDVLSYLKSENKYTEQQMSPMKELQNSIFTEMKGRLKKADQSVPVKYGSFYYYSKYEEESEHPIIVRKKKLSDPEEVILDVNKLAAKEKFFKLGGWEVSPDGNTLAYGADKVGRRIFTIHFKNLSTRKNLKFTIEKVTSNFEWAEDGKHFFYTKQNAKTLRSEWIYRFNLQSQKSDLTYHEKDEKFYAGIWKTRTKKFLVISTGSSESSEALLIPAAKPLTAPRLFAKRRQGHEYSVEDAGSFFLVRSNHKAENFKIFRTTNHISTDESSWKTFLAHRKSVLVESIDAFKNYFFLDVRKGGFTEIEIIERKTGERHILPQEEKSHVVYSNSSPNYNSNVLRYSYQSMSTPPSVIDYNMNTQKKTVRKVKEVLGDFDSRNYESKQIFAKAKDGTKIPISLVHRKGLKLDGSNPVVLYGYGSYGASMEPWFSSNRLSLLDRGFIFAIAHIRGGSEMGRHWYLDGKRFKKKNTFTDFIAAAEALISKKYTCSEKLFTMGGSAGGLLMGAIINMRPKLFYGVVAAVPFVDVLTTMLDESIPLTTNEFEEWGNPKDKKYYNYIKSYSPYDNVKVQKYPHMLVTSGLHDSQVQYWEPTKWVARLREMKTDNNLLLLDTNMEAGHGGKSGRFKVLQDAARDYAFIVYLNENR